MTASETSNRPRHGSLHPRKPLFRPNPQANRHWNGADAPRTWLMNAFSGILPIGEKYFVKIMREAEIRLAGNPELQAEARGFCAQEGRHSLAHREMNAVIHAQGYTWLARFPSVEDSVFSLMMRHLSNDSLLAALTACEHMTSILANELLNNPEFWLGDAEPAMAAIWIWHAVEETEHQSTCHDIYEELCGERWRLHLAMSYVTAILWLGVGGRTLAQQTQDGRLFSPRAWKDQLGYWLGKKGMLPSLAKNYFRYFAKDFHPSELRNQHLVGIWDGLSASGRDNGRLDARTFASAIQGSLATQRT